MQRRMKYDTDDKLLIKSTNKFSQFDSKASIDSEIGIYIIILFYYILYI